jgi:hypothetical protein
MEALLSMRSEIRKAVVIARDTIKRSGEWVSFEDDGEQLCCEIIRGHR